MRNKYASNTKLKPDVRTAATWIYTLVASTNQFLYKDMSNKIL